jgi:hypothetical protein
MGPGQHLWAASFHKQAQADKRITFRDPEKTGGGPRLHPYQLLLAEGPQHWGQGWRL